MTISLQTKMPCAVREWFNGQESEAWKAQRTQGTPPKIWAIGNGAGNQVMQAYLRPRIVSLQKIIGILVCDYSRKLKTG